MTVYGIVDLLNMSILIQVINNGNDIHVDLRFLCYNRKNY